ncbi:hypothetical protein [Arenibacter lacus]|uniref:hypothetical protein n=1 Tax=Arenibacter lacus TaxID=2608629 RepID=UPI00123D9889|nr:hypothetical protein [Arenibacter lacus]
MENNNKTITLGGVPNPLNNTVVIVVGGVAADKPSILGDSLDLNGITISSDKAYALAMQSNKARAELMDRWGLEINKVDMSNPEEVDDMYYKIDRVAHPSAWTPKELSSWLNRNKPEIKPNLIYLDAVDESIDFFNLAHAIKGYGYDKKDIHVVWIAESLDTVKSRKLDSKGRPTTAAVISQTHWFITRLMKNLLTDPSYESKYMDGDIWMVMENDRIIQLKESGSPVNKNKLTKEVMDMFEQSPDHISSDFNTNKKKKSKKQFNREIRERHLRNQKQSDIDALWDTIEKRYF